MHEPYNPSARKQVVGRSQRLKYQILTVQRPLYITALPQTGCLKKNRWGCSHASGEQRLKSRCQEDHSPSEDQRGELELYVPQFLGVLEIPGLGPHHCNLVFYSILLFQTSSPPSSSLRCVWLHYSCRMSLSSWDLELWPHRVILLGSGVWDTSTYFESHGPIYWNLWT